MNLWKLLVGAGVGFGVVYLITRSGVSTTAELDELSADPCYFEFDSFELNHEAKVRLTRLSLLLMRTPYHVRVVGHTDDQGSEAYNQALSEQRAVAASNYLIAAGVDGNRIHPEGHGELEPIASNDTEQGRALNRRVDIEILRSWAV